MDNKITEAQAAALHDGMQVIINSALENQLADCNTMRDFSEWQYSVSKDDVIFILKELDINTIEKQVIKEIPLIEFFYKASE